MTISHVEAFGKVGKRFTINEASKPMVGDQQPTIAQPRETTNARQAVSPVLNITKSGVAAHNDMAPARLDSGAEFPLANPVNESPAQSILDRHLKGHTATLFGDTHKSQPATAINPQPPMSMDVTVRMEAAIDVLADIIWDLRVPGQNLTPAYGPALIKAEMPPQIPQQIANAIHSSSEKTVEIALNPIELGRVRMMLSATEVGISVSVLADRPEILELMRRNIDDLGQSFAELGYDDVSFSFEQGNHTSDSDTETESDDPDFAGSEAVGGDISAPTIPGLPRLSIAPEGVDMRF